MIFTCTSKGNTLPNGLFSGSTDPRQSMMTAPSMNVASPLCSTLIICSLDQSPTRARTWGFKPKKVYPWGVPPRVSSRVQSPHVMSLHQSAPLVDSLNHVARSVWAHSTLFSVAVQDGELAAVHCAVLRTNRHVVRNVEDSPSPPDGSRMFPRPLQTLHS